MQLHFEVAGVGSRFLAIAIDTLIQAGAALVIILVAAMAGIIGVFRFVPQGNLWGLALLIGLMFLLYSGYFAVFEIIWSGQTPGKRAIGIRVIKDTGRPLSPSESIGRNLLRVVDQIPGFYAVGVITAMLNKQNRRLGDFVAGSLVVREKSLGDLKPVWQMDGRTGSESPLGAEKLDPRDLALIEAFLNRRYELTPDVRARMADEIVRRLQDRLSLTVDQGAAPERTLERLSYERRRANY